MSHPLRDRDDLLERLRKIEGQVRGLQRMIEDDRQCTDILVQIAAVKAGVNRVGLSVLESHARGCVHDALREEKGDLAMDELVEVLMKYVK
ncbi:MAG: metal-sensitive transcriptional regulator [Firmicutes bacterium]|nr:metal-sensitive transcriptional regulator [Bacillota bacterium]